MISIKNQNNLQLVTFLYKNKIFQFKTQLIGKIQIKDLLMAVAAAVKSNLKIDDIVKNLEHIKPVNGRLELLEKLKIILLLF